MDLRLADKVVLVSGGSGGIGKAIALEFAMQQAAVLIVARRQEPLQATVEELKKFNTRVAYVCADMTQEQGVNTAIAESNALFGTVPDVVVCNVRSLIRCGFEMASADDFRTSSEQCVMSVVHLAKAVLPSWKEKGWGRFINLGSVCTLEPHRWYHIVLGNTFRLAAVGLMRSLSNEFSSFGITFNTVAIGLINTSTTEKIVKDGEAQSLLQSEPQPVISMRRAGSPEEIAAQVVFLASQRASYITGQNIAVDGGWTRGI